MRLEAMSLPSAPQPEPLRAVFFRKLSFLVLVILAVALGLSILSWKIRTAASFLQILLSDITLGLASGFFARLFFRKYMEVLRFASAFAVLAGGLALLGLFTGWQVGLGPLKWAGRGVDWSSLGQLVMGLGVCVLALQAWQPPPVQVPRPAPRPRRSRPVRGPRKEPGKRPRRGRTAAGTGALGKAVEPLPAIAGEVSLKQKRKRIRRRKPQLLLSVEEEHRCPYCLELVKPGDPRGVVECKICHTLHHADCWAITGACQVPHYTA